MTTIDQAKTTAAEAMKQTPKLRDENTVLKGMLNDDTLKKNVLESKLNLETSDGTKADFTVKDILKAINTLIPATSKNDSYLIANKLATSPLTVNRKTIKAGHFTIGSEDVAYMQLGLGADTDGFLGKDTLALIGALGVDQTLKTSTINNTGGTNSGTNTGDKKLDTGTITLIEGDIKEKINLMDEDGFKDYIKPAMAAKFLRAKNNGIFNEGKFQNTQSGGNGYYTINSKKGTLDIHISEYNSKLPAIQGKIYSLDLNKFVDTKDLRVVIPESFVPELYKAIDKMYNEETLGSDLYSKSADISEEYDSINKGSDLPLQKSEKINKLIVRLQNLKKEAEGLKTSSSSTTYDSFIFGRANEIKTYTAKNNEYIRLSVAQSLTDLYKGNTTKEGDATTERINFLKTESKELTRLKKFITASEKSYKGGYETIYDKSLKAINDRLVKIPLEQTYVTTKQSDLKDVADLKLMAEGIAKRGAVAEFKKEIKTDAHREAYTKYLGSKAGIAEFIKICGNYF